MHTLWARNILTLIIGLLSIYPIRDLIMLFPEFKEFLILSAKLDLPIIVFVFALPWVLTWAVVALVQEHLPQKDIK